MPYQAELPAAHVGKVRFGFWVTTPARTVVDIARISTFMQGVVVADSVLRNEAATEHDLKGVLDACPRWPGIALARRVTEFADPLAESVLESCARATFHEHGLERPLLQESPAPGIRVDFCWPRYKLVVEADGLAKYERDPTRKIAEQTKRDNRLRRLGYTIIHFTWAELFGNTVALIDDIKLAMAAGRPPLGEGRSKDS
jgi:very-short-patch-repair endonuclease